MNAYNLNHGITDTLNCNAYGLTSPKPYNQQLIYSNKPVYTTRPDTCDCNQISSIYKNYQAVAFHYSSFSDYLNQEYQTVISDSVLNQLMSMCNNASADTNCNYLTTPIQLPPVLQCTSGNVCISCYQFSLVSTQFIQKYPGIVPVANPVPTDSAQLGKNELYEEFMNYHFGFSKHASEYLSFMTSCGTNYFTSQVTAQCDSLAILRSNFRTAYYPDTTQCDSNHFKITLSDGTEILTNDYPQIFTNGMAHVPESLLSGTPYDGSKIFIEKDDTICVYNNFTIEARMKGDSADLIGAQLCKGMNFVFWADDVTNCFSPTFAMPGANLGLCGVGLFTCQTSWDYTNQLQYERNLMDWFTVKMVFKNDTVNLYVNDTLIRSAPYTVPINKITKYVMGTGRGYFNYVKVYDSLGVLQYLENFNDCKQSASNYPAAFSCKTDCQSAFTAYYNLHNSTSYSYAQIDSIYFAHCGTYANACLDTSVATILVNTDSLTAIKNQFAAFTRNSFSNTVCSDTATWKVYQNQNFSNDDYSVSLIPNNTGVPAYSIFNGGSAKLPASYPSVNYISYIHQMDTICLTGKYSVEARIRFNTTSTDSLHRMIGYFDSRSDTLANFYFLPNAVDSGTWRIAHWDMSASGDSIKINKLGLIFPNAVGNTGEIDWVRLKDQSGNVILFEDFNSYQQFAAPATAYQCAPATGSRAVCSSCQLAFQQYYNSVQNTNLTYAQIQTIYQQNGDSLNICPIADASLTLCGTATPLFPIVSLDSVSNCMDSLFFAVSKGMVLYNAYTDSLKGSFDSAYRAKCLQAYKYESFTVTHLANEYHYTLYYYDQAGNLVKTIPPEGVHPIYRSGWLDSVNVYRAANLSLTNTHGLLTQYRYNTLNQVVAQQTPDITSQSSFWYDRLGRLSISQNARQRTASGTETNSLYSYTLY